MSPFKTSASNAHHINAPTRFEIQGDYVFFITDADGLTFSKFRDDARKEAEQLITLLDEADELDRQGEDPTGRRSTQSDWDIELERWQKKMEGKTLAEKYPNAQLILGAPFMEIGRDMAFVTTPTRNGTHTRCIPMEIYGPFVRHANHLVDNYLRGGNVVEWPNG